MAHHKCDRGDGGYWIDWELFYKCSICGELTAGNEEAYRPTPSNKEGKND